MLETIRQQLGERASLLDYKAQGVPTSMLHLPGPDFLDRVLVPSDRPPAVLRSLAAMFGTGRLARWIAGITGPDSVVGIDPLPDRVQVARANSPGVKFDVGTAEDLSAFGDASFDALSMSAVFHWIGDKPKALREAVYCPSLARAISVPSGEASVFSRTLTTLV